MQSAAFCQLKLQSYTRTYQQRNHRGHCPLCFFSLSFFFFLTFFYWRYDGTKDRESTKRTGQTGRQRGPHSAWHRNRSFFLIFFPPSSSSSRLLPSLSSSLRFFSFHPLTTPPCILSPFILSSQHHHPRASLPSSPSPPVMSEASGLGKSSRSVVSLKSP